MRENVERLSDPFRRWWILGPLGACQGKLYRVLSGLWVSPCGEQQAFLGSIER